MTAHDLYEHRNDYFLIPGTSMRGGLMLGTLIGAVCFGAGLMMDPLRAWGSFLFNLFFFFSIALGGSAFAGMQDVIGAQWARPIKRLHEAFAAFLPLAAILFIGFFIC